MEQVTVINTKNNMRRIYWVAGAKIEHLKLGPGANLVDADVIARIQTIPSVKKLFEQNILFAKPVPKAVKGYAGKGTYIENLAALKPDDALQAIAECEDPKILSQWLQQDGRKRVQDALFKRHDDLMNEKDPEGAGEKDAE